jgi:hypothetical protein
MRGRPGNDAIHPSGDDSADDPIHESEYQRAIHYRARDQHLHFLHHLHRGADHDRAGPHPERA